MNNSRAKKITFVLIRNIILNTLLAALKIAAGFIAGSIAVMSDGFNSLSDVATTAAVMISSYFTKETNDEEHQYGHEKIESVITLLIALFLGAGAVYTAYESFLRLISRHTVSLSWFALSATLLSAAVKFYMYRSTKKTANETESDSLLILAIDYRFDVFLSLSVFIGVLLAMLGMWFFESAAAIIASGFLLKSAVEFFVKAFNQLTDKAADEGTQNKIIDIVSACEGVCHVDILKTRIHGQKMYVDIEISVDPEISVLEGHKTAVQVHNRLEECGELKIKHCMVHVNPDTKNHE